MEFAYQIENSLEELKNYLGREPSLFFVFNLLTAQFIFFLSTWNFYKESSRKTWEALIPFYNDFVMVKYIIKKPICWAYALILLLLLNSIVTFKNLEYYIFDHLRHLGQRRYFYLNLILTGLWLITYFVRLYININLIKYFGKNKPKHILFLILSFGFYIAYLNYSKNLTYKKN